MYEQKMIHEKKPCKKEWIPILLIRLLLGLFFIVIGTQKLVVSYYHFTFLNLLKQLSFPLSDLFSYVIPSLECLCGLLIFLGYFTRVGSFLLFCMTLASLILTKLTAIPPFAYFMSFVYIPETLLSLILLWLTFSGGAEKSLDAYFQKKKR